MLPLTTAKAGGTFVFNTNCAPNQTPKTTSTIKLATMIVRRYSFFRIFFMAAVKVWLPYYEVLWFYVLLGFFGTSCLTLQKGKKKMREL